MKYYSATIRLGGSLLNEVRRHNLSAPEVMFLNAMHGGTAVSHLAQTGEKTFDAKEHARLRAELMQQYPKEKHAAMFSALFGTGRMAPLPESVDESDLRPEPEIEEEPYVPNPTAANETARQVKVVEKADAKASLRESIAKLGAELPAEDATVAEHRAVLRAAQDAMRPASVLD